MTNEELVRRMIDVLKEFAMTATYVDALDLAKQQFVANESTHNDWDILDENYKFINVKFAEAAIYELTTGKEVK
jgi:hypothetical protein